MINMYIITDSKYIKQKLSGLEGERNPQAAGDFNTSFLVIDRIT